MFVVAWPLHAKNYDTDDDDFDDDGLGCVAAKINGKCHLYF